MRDREAEVWENPENSDHIKALLRLMVKLKLLQDGSFERSFSSSDYLPIHHFALAGFFNEWEAIEKIAAHLNLKVFRPKQLEERDIADTLTHEPFSNVPLETWKRIRAIPIQLDGDKALVAFANPLDQEGKKALEFELGKSITQLITAEEEILKALALARGADNDSLELILAGSEDLEIKTEQDTSDTYESSLIQEDPNAAPVVKLVNKIFADAISKGASDIHISPQKESLNVRARVDGIMQDLFRVPDGLKLAVISRIKLLCGMDISERRKPQDGRVRLKTEYGVKDLRVSTVPSAFGENLVARILSPDFQNLDFDALGMPKELQKRYKRALSESSKISLVTGPTGSGKTSTLYASLIHLRDGTRNIITLEDPIEYRIDGITQIQVNPRIDFSFAEGLRSILRQDPDVVLVGEIRDQETAEIAIQTAQTGHLVLSTLHTNTAAGAVTRLRDLGVPSFMIASSLGSVVAQRLVRRLCPECKLKADRVTRAEAAELGIKVDGVYQQKGCKKCSDTGYRGRIAIYSLLEITEEIAELIRTDAGEKQIEEAARKQGYKTLLESGLLLVEQGITSMVEVERVLGELWKNNAAPVVQQQVEENSDGLKRYKILLVEDDEDMRTILKMLFERELYEVVEAENGRTALEALYENKPDIIVSDVMMPELNGAEMLRRIRADKRISSIPVLMLTAN
ncbi:MAG: type II/IV secretion system protein, partial [Candidatus Dadabacteria bacterium]